MHDRMSRVYKTQYKRLKIPSIHQTAEHMGVHTAKFSGLQLTMEFWRAAHQIFGMHGTQELAKLRKIAIYFDVFRAEMRLNHVIF